MLKNNLKKLFDLILKDKLTLDEQKVTINLLKIFSPRLIDATGMVSQSIDKKKLSELKTLSLKEHHSYSINFFYHPILKKLNAHQKKIWVKLNSDSAIFSEDDLIELSIIFNENYDAITSIPDTSIVCKFLKFTNDKYLALILDKINLLILNGRNDLINMLPNDLIFSPYITSSQKKILTEWKIFYSDQYGITSKILAQLAPSNNTDTLNKIIHKNKLTVAVFGRKISPNYISSATSYISWLLELNKQNINLIIFSDLPGNQVSNDFKANFHNWFDINGFSDQEVLHLIKKNQIDISLRIDCLRPIISDKFLKIPVVDVANTIDFYGGATYSIINNNQLTDWLIKNHRAKFFIFENYWHYTLPKLPNLKIESIKSNILGVFNRPTKISNQCYSDWINLLHHKTEYKIAFKFIQSHPNSHTSLHIKKLFSECGIDPSRVLTLPRTNQIDHLYNYNQMECILEPYPQCGGISTIESLWMNKPSLLCPMDDRNSSSGSLALYKYFDIKPHIFNFNENFSAQLESAMHDWERIQINYREKIEQSNLFNHQGFAQNVYLLLKLIQRQSCFKNIYEKDL